MAQRHFTVLAYVSHSVDARGKIGDEQIEGLAAIGQPQRLGQDRSRMVGRDDHGDRVVGRGPVQESGHHVGAGGNRPVDVVAPTERVDAIDTDLGAPHRGRRVAAHRQSRQRPEREPPLVQSLSDQSDAGSEHHHDPSVEALREPGTEQRLARAARHPQLRTLRTAGVYLGHGVECTHLVWPWGRSTQRGGLIDVSEHGHAATSPVAAARSLLSAASTTATTLSEATFRVAAT